MQKCHLALLLLQEVSDYRAVAELCSESEELIEATLKAASRPLGLLHSTFNEAILVSLIEDQSVSLKEKVAKIESIFKKITLVEKKAKCAVQSRMNKHLLAKASSLITSTSLTGS